MIENFPELHQVISFSRKGNKPVFDEMGNPIFPIITKNITAIVEDGISVLKEIALGYTVDKYIYIQELLKETDIITIEEREYIIKKISNCIDHYELMLVIKNV